MNGVSEAIKLSDDIDTSSEPARIPTTTLYELYMGVGACDKPEKEMEKINRVLLSRPIIELTNSIALLAGRNNGKLYRNDEELEPIDATIAATGLEYDEAIITDDIKDFSKFDDLDIISWRDDS